MEISIHIKCEDEQEALVVMQRLNAEIMPEDEEEGEEDE